MTDLRFHKFGDEDAASVYAEDDALPVITLVEDEHGTQIILPRSTYARSTLLGPEDVHRLGWFLLSQFMFYPEAQLDFIEKAVGNAIDKLEAWNERARADEEHPPYVDITNPLRNVAHALEELRRGIRKPDKERR